MKVAHVLAGVDEQSAGPSHSVTALALALQRADIDVDLHAVSGWRAPPSPFVQPPPRRHRQDFAGLPVLGQLCLSSGLYRALAADAAAKTIQLIHAHGLWLMPNVYPGQVARRCGTPLVISPRGMLGQAALGFSQAKKAAFWRLFQKRAVEASACLHATSLSEFEEIRAFGITTPVAIIPNGVDIPPLQARAATSERTILTLGRIHPKKGLVGLIEAWARLEAAHPTWRLRIVGPSELGHAEALLAQARRLGLERVSIEGPLFGDAKLDAYRAADLFVLPTLNENFAMTVAESLAAGVPAIVTKGAPWPGLESEGCGWWIDHGVEPLAAALQTAIATPDAELVAMGARGHAWMARAFSWDQVAAQMRDVYRWLVEAAAPPACVRFD